MKIIIRREPEPLVYGGKGKSYVAYYEDGAPYGKRALQLQDLKDWILEDSPEDTFEYEPDLAVECREVFDKVRLGSMTPEEFTDWALNFQT